MRITLAESNERVRVESALRFSSQLNVNKLWLDLWSGDIYIYIYIREPVQKVVLSFDTVLRLSDGECGMQGQTLHRNPCVL